MTIIFLISGSHKTGEPIGAILQVFILLNQPLNLYVYSHIFLVLSVLLLGVCSRLMSGRKSVHRTVNASPIWNI